MSLGSIYVEASDGKKYRNPTIEGAGWFICFNEDEPAELVIKTDLLITPVDLLRYLGIKGMLKFHGPASERIFNGEFHQATAYWLYLQEPIPVAAITKHGGVL